MDAAREEDAVLEAREDGFVFGFTGVGLSTATRSILILGGSALNLLPFPPRRGMVARGPGARRGGRKNNKGYEAYGRQASVANG